MKLVPFVSTQEDGPNPMVEVVVNLLLFLPYGAYLGLMVQSRPWLPSLVIIAGTSAVFEILQFVLAVGITDFTDVMVNTGGGMLGLSLYLLIHQWRGQAAELWAARLCITGTGLLLVLSFLFAVSPLRYAQLEVDTGELSEPPTRSVQEAAS